MNAREAFHTAHALLSEHNLFEAGWRFEFDGAVRRFGACHWTKKIITLSLPLTERNSPERVRNTILHEIAHALAGRTRQHHGPAWVAIAQRIGCDGKRCYESELVSRPDPKWVGICPGCGNRFERIRRPKRRYSCWCGGARKQTP